MRAVNSALLLFALGTSGVLAMGFGPGAPAMVPADEQRSERKPSDSAKDPHAVVDATGVTVSSGHYQRIVSASSVTDRVLLALCEHDRIAAVTAYSVAHDPGRHRLAGIPSLKRLDDLEQVLLLKPDLILMHGYGDISRITRLREQGLPVFDLGREQGFAALLDDIEQIGLLLRLEERADAYSLQLTERMEAVGAGVVETERRSALYLSPAGDRLYGGAPGSNQHDILHYAGLVDVAEGRFEGFPDYRVEDLLTLSPDVVVTSNGMARLLCQHPGLLDWAPCQRGQLIELDKGLLNLGGPSMVDAAAELHRRVYGREAETTH